MKRYQMSALKSLKSVWNKQLRSQKKTIQLKNNRKKRLEFAWKHANNMGIEKMLFFVAKQTNSFSSDWRHKEKCSL